MSATTGDPCVNPDCGRGYDDCTKTVLRKKSPHACCSECAYTDTHNVRQAPTPTDPTWLRDAVEAGAGAYDLRGIILAALPAITGGIAEAVKCPSDFTVRDAADGGYLDGRNDGADRVRNFGSDVSR